MSKGNWNEPATIFGEYKKGADYKAGLGRLGLYEQNRINERFYIGDHWHGVQCGDQKPLIRYGVIRRIGDYKMAMAAGAAVAVNFSAEGVPNTAEMRDHVRERKEQYRVANFDRKVDPTSGTVPPAEEINLVMDALGDYFKVTAERVKFDDLKSRALRNAYTGGTGVIYTYWDELVKTGLYADEGRTSPILGDIRCEVLSIEDVYFGDPATDDVQAQPYIIIAQRRSVEELRREARRNHRPTDEVEAIKPDRDTEYLAGDARDNEPAEERKATVLTKFYKKYNEDGTAYTIQAVRVVQGATIRKAWDIRVRLYPLAKISWESVPNCAYGMSEVTHLVPNQIAINRAITAAAQAVMMMGMPIMVVNGDVVTGTVTNDPGQIITVYGATDMDHAIRYVAPANFTPQFDNLINSMIANTLSQSGANDAALGDMKPDNTSAIIALREAATMPLQMLKNRFYSFVEDVARIWAEFWVRLYGVRQLKMADEKGEWYIPFDGGKYQDILIKARVDVGPANLWSEITAQQTLDSLYKNQIISDLQYLERLPRGTVEDVEGLIREKREQTQAPPMTGNDGDITGALAQLPEEYRQKLMGMTPEQRTQVVQRLAGRTAQG